MRLASFHADGSIHRVWESVLTTEDPWAFWIPPYSPVEEASGVSWHSDYPVVGLFWPTRFYQVFLLLKETETDYYCNIIAPPSYNAAAEQVEFVDLDLDVLLTGGDVRVADEDEFAVRSATYSQMFIREAQAAKHRVVAEAKARTGPFTLRTARKWRDYVRAKSSATTKF